MSSEISMSEDHSVRLGLPYLAAGQMQKHVTLNAALTRLDALVQTAVVSRSTSVQPGSPTDGALWIVPDGATGADWSTRAAGVLMRAEGGGWTAVEPTDGLIALVLDEAVMVIRHGGSWTALGARLGEAQALARLGVGAAADASNPFIARLNAALWTALDAGSGGTGDLRLTLNKAESADVLSLLFQSGYGGRAELGLVGDDDLRLKVSGDGANWHDAFAVDRTTGQITFARGAGRRTTTVFAASGAYVVPAWARSVEAVLVGGGGGGGAGASGPSGARHGGGGGGAGGVSRAEWPADQLGETLAVTVGADGAGGVGGAGWDGGDSAVLMDGLVLRVAPGGSGGGGGDSLGGAGGRGGAHGNAGGDSSVSGPGGPGRSLDCPEASGGGGAGGGLDGAGVTHAGGPGGDGGALGILADGGAGGTDAPGAPGWVAPHPSLFWAGGGGGGGGAVSSGAGHAGAAGGSAGAGGGGGGAGVSAGGDGGAGTAGVVWLVAVG
jgi:hypothetical protein